MIRICQLQRLTAVLGQRTLTGCDQQPADLILCQSPPLAPTVSLFIKLRRSRKWIGNQAIAFNAPVAERCQCHQVRIDRAGGRPIDYIRLSPDPSFHRSAIHITEQLETAPFDNAVKAAFHIRHVSFGHAGLTAFAPFGLQVAEIAFDMQIDGRRLMIQHGIFGGGPATGSHLVSPGLQLRQQPLGGVQ
ncbi:MAG: hypothetical protein WD768_03820 [Phycisphaeraceae bacterium]